LLAAILESAGSERGTRHESWALKYAAERFAGALGLGAGSARRGVLPTATVSPIYRRVPAPLAAVDPQQEESLRPGPPGPRAAGGQQAPTLGAQVLFTPGRGRANSS